MHRPVVMASRWLKNFWYRETMEGIVHDDGHYMVRYCRHDINKRLIRGDLRQVFRRFRVQKCIAKLGARDDLLATTWYESKGTSWLPLSTVLEQWLYS